VQSGQAVEELDKEGGIEKGRRPEYEDVEGRGPVGAAPARAGSWSHWPSERCECFFYEVNQHLWPRETSWTCSSYGPVNRLLGNDWLFFGLRVLDHGLHQLFHFRISGNPDWSTTNWGWSFLQAWAGSGFRVHGPHAVVVAYVTWTPAGPLRSPSTKSSARPAPSTALYYAEQVSPRKHPSSPTTFARFFTIHDHGSLEPRQRKASLLLRFKLRHAPHRLPRRWLE
jgi:hypothetical protein